MFWRKKNKKVKQKDELNPDYIELINYYKWLIKETDIVEFGKQETNIELSKEFKQVFSKLSKLIQSARILNLKINNDEYKLFGWTNKNNIRCGWINKFENNVDSKLNLIDEHKLLLNSIGGIWESFNQPEPSLTLNQEFLFIESECLSGIGGWDEYYEVSLEQGEFEPIDYKDFICFAREANGDVTLYNPTNKKVFLFAHDHCFDNVEFLLNQPEYTFHKINGVINFKDYVEKLASEWINHIIMNE